MERILVTALTEADIGSYYDYEYLVDQGKGEITKIRQGLYEIRNVEHHPDGSVTIYNPNGPQRFSEDTYILLHTDNLPTGNN
jgi:hypothetical protein